MSGTGGQDMEVRAIGAVDAGAALEELMQLLLGLSGAPPQALEQLEVVLCAPAAAPAADGVPASWRPDLRLQHEVAHASTSGGAGEGDRWTVLQFSLHLRGKQHAALPAAVRHVTRTHCTGGDVPALWVALGFAPRYQLLRRGHRFQVQLGGQEIEVSVCRVLRLPAASSGGGSTPSAAALQAAEDVAPGRLLVEAVAWVPPEGDHMDSVAAVTSLAALLQPHTALQRPPRAPKEPM